LRFLSAGNHSIQKGTLYLLEAWRRLKPSTNMTLLLVGDIALPEDQIRNLPENVELHPRVSHSELQVVLRESDVLLLPTLAEGRSHMVLEALAAGLAIITTENSGCGDLIEEGVNGWKIPIRDSDALADRIIWCGEHPAEVEAMQCESITKAKGWQVEDFMKRHAEVIIEFVRHRDRI
jgi:glycosyltransferase involved in cell wall biosynthesis